MRTSFLPPLSPRTIGLSAALVTAICWSFLAIFIKIALNFADAQTIVWYRMATAFVLLAGFLLASRRLSDFNVLISKPGILTTAALCLSANYLGYMKAIELTSPANAQVFIQTGPILLALSGVVFFHEKLKKPQIVGLVVCLAGFGLFFYEKFSGASLRSETYLVGQAWVFMAAITWAIFAGLQKVLLKKWSSNQVNLYIYLVATLIFLPSVDGPLLLSLPLKVHGLFIFLGFNTLLAYGGLSLALKHLPVTQVSPLITLNPLVTLLLLYLMESAQWKIIPADPITHLGYVGAILAVLGVIFIVRK